MSTWSSRVRWPHNATWRGCRRSYDTQAVLATDKVRFQGQEVARSDGPRHGPGGVPAPQSSEGRSVPTQVGVRLPRRLGPSTSPNLTWPFACYIATVEVDPETGVWDVLRFVGVDDCGVRINPMIVEGQIMGGLTEAYAMANMQFMTYDENGNIIGGNYMDYLLPDCLGSARLRAARGRHPVPAPPDRRQGRRRVRGCRRARSLRQRGHQRADRHRRPEHRHAGPAGPGVAGAAEPARTFRARRPSRPTERAADVHRTRTSDHRRCRGGAAPSHTWSQMAEVERRDQDRRRSATSSARRSSSSRTPSPPTRASPRA